MPELQLTYPEVGATLADDLPAGYHHLEVASRVGPASSYDDVVAFVLGWGLQRGAGLRVPADLPAANAGLRATLRLGPLRVPVEVVAVLDEPDRRGFAYGTLAGHPECGEELFAVERRRDGTWVAIRAFSRAGTRISRWSGPAGRLAQRWMTTRYLTAAERVGGRSR